MNQGDYWSQFRQKENQQTAVQEPSQKKGDFWDQYREESQDSTLQSIGRWTAQPILGAAQKFTYPIDLLQMIGIGSAIDPEEIDQIRRISEQQGIPFDEEQYLREAQQAASMFPTQGNIERFIEEKTGLPLTPKTQGQKLLRFGSSTAAFTPGGATQKAIGGATGTGTKVALEAAGVPEFFADIAGNVAGIGVGAAAGKTPVTKTSGMPERKYEGIETPRKVSEKTYGKIQEAIKSDVEDATKKVLEKSPYQEISERFEVNPEYIADVEQGFQQVQDIAESIPKKIPAKAVKKKMVQDFDIKFDKGVYPTEYQKDIKKYFNQQIKDIKSGEVSAADFVSQYRENNKFLKGSYDPSKSYVANRAKTDAVLEANRIIGDIIEKTYPDTGLGKLFREQNKKWTEIKDYQSINEFNQALTKEKMNYAKARKFLESENTQRPFKRILGDEGFEAYKDILKDFLGTEKSINMLKVAKSKGWNDLVKDVGVFVGLGIVNPKLAGAYKGVQLGAAGFKWLSDRSLSDPKYMTRFRDGLSFVQEGNFEKASKIFSELNDEYQKSSKKKNQK